jgi:hypothetical protein
VLASSLLVIASCSLHPSMSIWTVRSVNGQQVCLTSVKDPTYRRCLNAGVELGSNDLVGQAPDWYSSRIDHCVEVATVADGPWGRTTNDVPCPRAEPTTTR